MNLTERFAQVLRALECSECGRREEHRYPERLSFEQCVAVEGWEITARFPGGQTLHCDRCRAK